MIVCVALNPALDITYDLDEPVVNGATNRARAIHVRPGGKALNVAAVLGELDIPARVIAPLGGSVGATVRALADQHGFVAAWVPIVGTTRRTIVTWDPTSDEATTLSEPGPVISADEWASLRETVRTAMPADAMVIAGSVASGLPSPAVADLVRVGRSAGTPVFVDTSAPVLRECVEAGADVIKPNRDELTAAVGRAISPGLDALAAAARELVGPDDPTVVVASSGPEGLLAVDGTGRRWSARSPVVTGGNPTGAGDAALAAIVAERIRGRAWDDTLRIAAAMGAMACTQAYAGTIGDPDRLASVLARTTNDMAVAARRDGSSVPGVPNER